MEVLLVVADEAPAAGEPCERSLDQPAFGQHDEALGLIGALDDGKLPVARFAHRGRRNIPLVATVGEDDPDEREERPGLFVEHQGGTVAVLNTGVVDHHAQQQAKRVDADVVLDAFDLLSRVVADRIRRRPPFSAERTLWLSTTAAVGLASRPSCSRTRA